MRFSRTLKISPFLVVALSCLMIVISTLARSY